MFVRLSPYRVKPMPNDSRRTLGKRLVLVFTMLGLVSMATAQNTTNTLGAETVANQPTSNAPLTLTLQDALARARKNSPEYRAALTEYGLAKEDRVQGPAALRQLRRGISLHTGERHNRGAICGCERST